LNSPNPVPFGPVKAELKAGGSAFIEFDNEGITDAGVKARIGAEARWGWNSGGSIAGKALLKGLSIILKSKLLMKI